MKRKMTNSGRMTAAIGAIRWEMIQNATLSLPRKDERASP